LELVILPVLLYGCETWSLTFEGETQTEDSEKRVLRIFGPKMEDDGSCRKLRNDELHNLYSSPNTVRVIKSRKMSWVGHVARMGEGRGVYWVLVGRPGGNRPLGRPRWTLGRKGSMGRTELGWLRIGSNGGLL
jgi:hypothetical protein